MPKECAFIPVVSNGTKSTWKSIRIAEELLKYLCFYFCLYSLKGKSTILKGVKDISSGEKGIFSSFLSFLYPGHHFSRTTFKDLQCVGSIGGRAVLLTMNDVYLGVT